MVQLRIAVGVAGVWFATHDQTQLAHYYIPVGRKPLYLQSLQSLSRSASTRDNEKSEIRAGYGEMTIAKRIIASTVALGVGLIIAGSGIVFGFLTLRHLVTSTHEEFHELCNLRAISAHVTSAQRFHADGKLDSTEAELRESLAQLTRFNQFQDNAASEYGAQHADNEEYAAGRIHAALSTALAPLASSELNSTPNPAVRAALERASDELNSLMAHTEQAIADVHTETARQFTGTFWLLVMVETATLIVALAINVFLFRNVVTPLRHLRTGTDLLAKGKLDTRMVTSGDREFVDLQLGFNHMASELESLCRNLERRVAEKGRELAVAERLASVGFLAAGVAHEINNPLAIMSGYAESLLRTARNGNAAGESSAWIRDLETIRDEAFRCKRITQSLLDLSRMGDDHRVPVAVDQVVSQCISLIGAWPASRGVTFEIQQSLCVGSLVLASEPELKQVILNLLANAVEASTPTHGTVSVNWHQHNGWVDVVVRDNGRGMTPETLTRVFEPFFSTDKPRPGMGLGLSISHAIARRHGGTLEAQSPGPGCGSTLVLRLPAMKEAST